VELKKQIDE
jgi:hypothetical protein